MGLERGAAGREGDASDGVEQCVAPGHVLNGGGSACWRLGEGMAGGVRSKAQAMLR